MARQSSPRPDADEPELDDATSPAESGADTALADANTAESDADTAAAEAARALWDELRIDPVRSPCPPAPATPSGLQSGPELTPTDVTERDQDDPFLARLRFARPRTKDDSVVILDEDVAQEFAESDDEDAKASRGDADDEDTEAAEEDAGDDEVPAFLSHRGRLLLFKTPESLVSFIRSGAPNDLSQLDSWNELSERVEPADIAPLGEDVYELDLVVENLRGGHDTWDATLLIEAGEVARDLAYALRLPAVLDMLSAGSSLDDLDEALRATMGGGVGGFMGRRRLKKIGAQTASLGWRTIVGKISAVVDWRD